ncbi:MAG: hypothetical protein R2831_03635 [Chitinophagaceae bacterium]
MQYQKYFPNHIIIGLIFCYCLGSSCRSKTDVPHPTLSQIDLPLTSYRFDSALYSIDTSHLLQGIEQLGLAQPDFTSLFFQQITGFEKHGLDQDFIKAVHHFLTYKDYRNLYDSVQKKYPQVKDIDQKLETLFKHIHYYFPEEKWQQVYYFISGLNQWSAITYDSIVGVGLDMHLGKDFPFYQSANLGFAQYQIDRFEKEYIPINVAKVIYENKYPFVPENSTLLDMMIQKGKQMQFLAYTMPDTKANLLLGYTPEQLKWCEDNERMIWNFFAAKKLLYATQWQEIFRYINDGPTSTGMPPESPGNIGTWIGWRIIQHYMNEHPEKTLPNVLNEKQNSLQLLKEAKYKP